MTRKRKPDAEPSSLSGWAMAVVRTISASGIDPQPLLQQAGITSAQLTDPEARVAVEKMTRLWRLAVSASGDEALGLRVPPYLDPSSLFAMQTLTLAAPTAVDGWNLFARYMPVLSTGLKVELQSLGERQYALVSEANLPGVGAAPEAGDATAACLIASLRNQRELGIDITAIELTRPEPQDAAEFERLLGAPVSFDSPLWRIQFNTRQSLHSPQQSANPALEQALQQVLQEYLQRMQSQGFVEQVKREIATAMTHSEPSLARVAQQLHVSARTLQRRLVDEGSLYSDLVNEVRQNMARELVSQSELNITDIAFRLGFRDASNFSRVFRRWFGQTPSDFRKTS